MNDIEQDWAGSFKQKCTSVPAAIITTNPLLEIPDTSRSTKLNLPRSSSLDKLYYYSNNKKNDTLKSLFPPSGYDDTDSDEDDYEAQNVQLLRSFTVGSKDTIHHREMWKFSASTNPNVMHPDTTHASKKPPVFGHEIRISNGLGTIHAITTRGPIIVIGTSHYNIKSYNIRNASETLFNSSLPIPCPQETTSTDIIRSICFSPAMHPNDDNQIVWAGTENGSILAMNVQSNEIIVKRMATHSQPITFMLRNRNTELWTMDDGGTLNIWSILKITTGNSSSSSNSSNNSSSSISSSSSSGSSSNSNSSSSSSSSNSSSAINLSETTPERFQVTTNAKTTILSPTKSNILWLSSGRSIDRFDRSILVPVIKIPTELGDITKLFTIPFHHNQIFAVHVDGQISAWDETTFENCLCFTVSIDKLTAVLPVGTFYLWAGFSNGMAAIYDTRTEPWIVVKIWKAHKNAITKFTVDEFSVFETMPVISVDSVGHIAIWDGLLADHWIEEQIVTHLSDYCSFSPLETLICSWNMDAIKPDALTESDVKKVHEWLNGMSNPDIIMVGIQEIVDLSSKTLTAKSFLSLSKKIETIEEADELLTHRYMLWHDYLMSIIDNNFGKNTYKIIKTDQMVGLFSCIFVKESIKNRIHQCDSNVVKTGFRLMNKSLHGNKGGIATRLVIDDSSICFINCHLAAGQSNVLTRNVDVDGILHSARFPPLALTENKQQAAFKLDSNGTNILDHEVCFLSGDLNYRIGIKRDQVLALLAEGNNKFEAWEILQQEDQLKKQLALNPMFRMFGFKEPPILFDPTYKYDRGTDFYDRSEKKRAPAWCDRILHRGPASMSNAFYRRHELKASDHRPISAGFTIHAKTVCQDKLDQVKARIELEWQQTVLKYLHDNKIRYVTHYDLCDEKEAMGRLEKVDWDVERVVMDLYRDKGCYYV